jgi:hypothetical protein
METIKIQQISRKRSDKITTRNDNDIKYALMSLSVCNSVLFDGEFEWIKGLLKKCWFIVNLKE